MTNMILVYITCEDVEQAKKIGKHLLDKRLCVCINIFPNMQSACFWPPKSDKIEEANEVVLIAKTLESKYQDLEDEVHKIHTYEIPCVFAIPVTHVAKKYYDWINGELE